MSDNMMVDNLNVRDGTDIGVFNVDLAPEVISSFLNGTAVEKMIPDHVAVAMPTNNTKYKYSEDTSLAEISSYIEETYSQHYSQNKFQATEFIIDSGHGTGFCMGNVMKYAQRYGRKGTATDARRDLLKVIHYAIMQLHVHDLENGSK